MAGVFPFRGVHYADLSSLASLTAPPYDVISPADQQALYDASPHNIVRLELAKGVTPEGGGDGYAQAGALLDRWMNEGVLRRDDRPGFYVYRQGYSLPDGSVHFRTGFFGEVALEEFSTGVVRPHEETFAGPKEDRLRLLRACRANLSPIFGLYRDVPDVTRMLASVVETAPLADFTDRTGLRNQVWRLDDSGSCDAIARAMSDRQILIADGHHRYETALAYRRERAAAGGDDPTAWYQRLLFVLVSMSDPGLVVLPTHRILKQVDPTAMEGWMDRVQGQVEITPIEPDSDSVRWALADGSGGASRYVLATAERTYLVELAPVGGAPLDQLDISRLHRELLPAVAGTGDAHRIGIVYTQDLNVALGAVHRGEAPAALLVNSTPVERVDAISASGARMPEKSTYFYPKLSTGVVIRVEPGGGRD